MYSDDIAPGGKISFIHGGDRPQVDQAVWWLLLDPVSLRPNDKYASFNSRYDKLNQSRSIAYKPYRESRCIIPASAFVEGLGDKKTYHLIELEDQAIAFGGLFKEHINHESGEIFYSASIITLPPIPEWKHIHPRSFPLMLDFNNEPTLVEKWLDRDFHEVAAFERLLKSKNWQRQIISPIDRPSTKKKMDIDLL